MFEIHGDGAGRGKAENNAVFIDHVRGAIGLKTVSDAPRCRMADQCWVSKMVRDGGEVSAVHGVLESEG